MKHIAIALVTIAWVGLANVAIAGPFDLGDSILLSRRGSVAEAPLDQGPATIPSVPSTVEPRAVTRSPLTMTSAPSLDATAAPVEIAAPIQAGTVEAPAPAVQQPPAPMQRHHHHHHAQKKQSVFDKLMEMERKKNAWLKRTFLGR